MDPDERIGGVIRLLFDKFKELGSARVARPGGIPHGADDLRHPVYAGDYVFGRTTRARMSSTAARAGPPAIPSR